VAKNLLKAQDVALSPWLQDGRNVCSIVWIRNYPDLLGAERLLYEQPRAWNSDIRDAHWQRQAVGIIVREFGPEWKGPSATGENDLKWLVFNSPSAGAV